MTHAKYSSHRPRSERTLAIDSYSPPPSPRSDDYLHTRCVCCAAQGKTLQLIALILARPPSGENYVAKVRAVEENKRNLERLQAAERAAERGETTLPEVTRTHDMYDMAGQGE